MANWVYFTKCYFYRNNNQAKWWDMSSRSWMKVKKAGPGQYWCGGAGKTPCSHPWLMNLDQEYMFSVNDPDGRWMFYAGPKLSEPPKYIPVPADGGKVMITTNGGTVWLKAYSSGRTDACGNLLIYDCRLDKWLSGGEVTPAFHWRLPTEEEKS